MKTQFEYSMDRETFIEVLNSFRNKWYTWGGDDPSGFDCSGSIVAGLKAVGYMIKGEDLSADAMFKKYSNWENNHPRAGALAFWFNKEGKAIHVAMCLNQYFCLTADGGGKFVKTLEDAIKHNAFMKVRPVLYRSTDPRYLYVFEDAPERVEEDS